MVRQQSKRPLEDESAAQQSISTFLQAKKKYAVDDPRQKKITEALLMFITNDLMPLSVVDSVNFQALLEELNPQYSLPNRKHLTIKLLHQKSMDIQARMKSAFQKAESVCLTIDL